MACLILLLAECFPFPILFPSSNAVSNVIALTSPIPLILDNRSRDVFAKFSKPSNSIRIFVAKSLTDNSLVPVLKSMASKSISPSFSNPLVLNFSLGLSSRGMSYIL